MQDINFLGMLGLIACAVLVVLPPQWDPAIWFSQKMEDWRGRQEGK